MVLLPSGGHQNSQSSQDVAEHCRHKHGCICIRVARVRVSIMRAMTKVNSIIKPWCRTQASIEHTLMSSSLPSLAIYLGGIGPAAVLRKL
jgi:hypothetical protein